MKNMLNLEEIRNKVSTTLYDLLKEKDIYKGESLDAYIHALADISESIEKVYYEHIPKLLETQNEIDIKEILWDIREEFRHIDYHMKDSRITEI